MENIENGAHNNFLNLGNIVELPESEDMSAEGEDNIVSFSGQERIEAADISKFVNVAALQVLNPVYNIVSELHKEIRNFIKTNIKPAKAIGFMSEMSHTINAEDLVIKINRASHLLDRIFDNIKNIGQVELICKESIVRTQTSLRGFLLQMSDFTDLSSISFNERGSALQYCIQLEGHLGMQVIQLEMCRGQIEH
jgi:hypothetical protein